MKRPPFKMLPSRGARLTRDGKHVVTGRASFVWETFLNARVSGVPGEYEIRATEKTAWHRLDWTMDEAEEMLLAYSMLGRGRQKVERMKRIRAGRLRRGLPVG